MADEVPVVDTSSKAASISHVELAFRRERKKERLRLAAEAQKKKDLQKARISEEKGKKQAKEKVTMRSYFLSSRNPDNSATIILSIGRPFTSLIEGSRKGDVSSTSVAFEVSNVGGRSESVSMDTIAVSVDTVVVSVNTVALSPASTLLKSNGTCTVLDSTPDTVMVSNDSSAYVCSEDNANFNEIQGMQ
jgi:hypothetical protein